MTDHIFALLTAKASFDRTRFEKDINVFSKKRDAATKSDGELSRFLNSGGKAAEVSPASEPRGKKRKGVKAAEVDDPEGVQLFRKQRAVSNGDASTSAPSPVADSRDPQEAPNVLRKRHRIKVSGAAPPAPLGAFEDLATRYSCRHKVLRNLVDAGFAEPTPIQRQAIPCLLEGHDLFAVAPTGSGKTLAFLLPGLMKAMELRKEDGGSEAGVTTLVLNPTRELAAQTYRAFKLLAADTGVKGCLLSKASAAGADFAKVQVLIAAPLLLVDLLKKTKVDLANLRFLILDEADKLFEMGFLEQIDAVFAACKRTDLCRALFSATLPEAVENAARSVLQLPTRITVGERNSAVSTVEQSLLFVGKEEGKLMALKQMIAGGVKPPVLVFVSSKERAQALHSELAFEGVHVDCIHADQPQLLRAKAVDDFRSGRTWVLIATDLIGRGMDFLGVSSVVNYDFPLTPTDYIHRIGRTGRAGRRGAAVTFFEEEDVGRLRAIANVMRAAGCVVPEWMLQLRKKRDPAGKGAAAGKPRARTAPVSVHADFQAKQAARKAQIVRQSKEKKLRERTQVKNPAS